MLVLIWIILIQIWQNLSWEQIKEIDENPLFDIGGHTHNHEIMSYLSDSELSEITTCLETLEEKLDRKISLFSYPEGQKKHYNEKVIQFLQKIQTWHYVHPNIRE